MTAPNFCMLLRKHINNGRIVSITQPGLERIVDFEIQHLDELGDIKIKHLIIELMGKHSNIIFTDDNNMIIDSIKHITSVMSSVRQVLPGKPYFIPDTMDKHNPMEATRESFMETVFSNAMPVSKAIFTSYTGISPAIAESLCFENKLDSSMPANVLAHGDQNLIWMSFYQLINRIKDGNFTPLIYEKNGKPEDFGAVPLSIYGDCTATNYESISLLLEDFYSKKNLYTRMRQKSSDLRRIVQTALERNRKKLNLQEKQMKDTAKKDKYKVYGELINTYGYGLEEGCKSFKALNYYTNEEITIPLDPTMTPVENSKKYFDKYGKLKRTEEALTEQIADTRSEIEHLESVSNALDIALAESDLAQIKEELMEYGYIKKHYDRKKGQKMQAKSKPFHYVTDDGYDIYVGKNNFQNDELTFKFATGNDWWFHAKKMAGSHVVVKSKDGELPDHIFEIAGGLAAYYSKGRTAPKVEIDYIQKKHVKKPAGSKPGFVVYYTNYSLMAEPSIKNVTEV